MTQRKRGANQKIVAGLIGAGAFVAAGIFFPAKEPTPPPPLPPPTPLKISPPAYTPPTPNDQAPDVNLPDPPHTSDDDRDWVNCRGFRCNINWF
jgi:hypothetical protein